MKNKGMIGFFDILGYQNIIMNNEIEEAANIINNIIIDLPGNVQQKIKEITGSSSARVTEPETAALIDDIIKSFDFLIISDSIIIFLPIDDTKYEKWKAIYWGIFFFYCCMFLDFSFRKGLPLRGAIEFGECFKKENCIAGKSIIDSYRQANELEFSGGTICNNAASIIRPFIKDELISLFVFEYLAPLANHIEKRLLLLNWALPLKSNSSLDIKQFTLKAFHAHNKDISAKVLGKLDNTERIIRYCLLLNDKRIEQK